MNAIGGGWMGSNNWGWSSTAATSVTIYPSYTVSDSTSAIVPSKPRSRTPLEWLRDQIDEITEAAIA